MKNDMTLEVVDKEEAKVIYTRDMMDYEINVYGTEEEPLFLVNDLINWLDYKEGYSASYLLKLCDNSEKTTRKIFWSHPLAIGFKRVEVTKVVPSPLLNSPKKVI